MEDEKIEQKITAIEQEILSLPYHKGTEHHIGKLKAKLAKLRTEIIDKQTKKKGTSKGFAIRKQGDATVVLVGFPSVGKSTLLNKLTEAKSKVAEYPFTTLHVIPGMLLFQGAKIQVLDVPGLIQGAAMGKGRGKEVLSVVRVADLLLLIASVKNPQGFEIMEQELSLAGVRLNQKKPAITIEKRLRGGLEISGVPRLISERTIKSLSQEFGVLNGKITLKGDVTQDQLIDTLLGNRIYVPALKILSKTDLISKTKQQKVLKEYSPNCLLMSAEKNIGLIKIKKRIFQELKLIRIYLRKSLADRPEKEPLICARGVSVLEAAQKISEELAQEIKGAKIIGPSAVHPNQSVGLNHQLQDKDEVFFIKK